MFTMFADFWVDFEQLPAGFRVWGMRIASDATIFTDFETPCVLPIESQVSPALTVYSGLSQSLGVAAVVL